jgi:hypothetical protein
MVRSVRAGGWDEGRCSGEASPSGAPQVAQNLEPGSSGEPQRRQAAPDPGAVRRRPQCGQKGSCELMGSLQKGQGDDAATFGAAAAGGDDGAGCIVSGRVPDGDVAGGAGLAAGALGDGDAPIDALALTADAALVRGLPQSMQNAAPASLARPQ